MSIDKHRFKLMLRRAAELWLEKASILSDIDSKFGDGDHGVTIGKIAKLFLIRTDAWDEELPEGQCSAAATTTSGRLGRGQAESLSHLSLHDFIEALGDGVMGISGGSAGPLYGTLVGGLAEPLNEETTIDGQMLKRMLAASLMAMSEITKARRGDKTMMDALIPAVEAALAAADDPARILSAAAQAAAAGAEATREMISKFGRARSYGKKTLGAPDAGAVSTALLFQGLHDGFTQ